MAQDVLVTRLGQHHFKASEKILPYPQHFLTLQCLRGAVAGDILCQGQC